MSTLERFEQWQSELRSKQKDSIIINSLYNWSSPDTEDSDDFDTYGCMYQFVKAMRSDYKINCI
jgi:hypothetical protein